MNKIPLRAFVLITAVLSSIFLGGCSGKENSQEASNRPANTSSPGALENAPVPETGKPSNLSKPNLPPVDFAKVAKYPGARVEPYPDPSGRIDNQAMCLVTKDAPAKVVKYYQKNFSAKQTGGKENTYELSAEFRGEKFNILVTRWAADMTVIVFKKPGATG